MALNELGLRNFIFAGCLFLLAHLQMCWVVPTMENEIEAWTVFRMAQLVTKHWMSPGELLNEPSGHHAIPESTRNNFFMQKLGPPLVSS